MPRCSAAVLGLAAALGALEPQPVGANFASTAEGPSVLDQNISEAQLQQELAITLTKLRAGEDCLAGMALPDFDSLNDSTVNESVNMEPVKIALRPWLSHRRATYCTEIILRETFRLPTQLVELDGSNDSNLIADFARVDLDVEMWSHADAQDLSDSGILDFGELGYPGWPGIYPSPSLLLALTQNETSIDLDAPNWFNYHHALGLPEVLNLLPLVGELCSAERCFIPEHCQGQGNCRVLWHESPLPTGESHMEGLIRAHELPLVAVYLNSSAWAKLLADWDHAPPQVVCSSGPPRFREARRRILFPYHSILPPDWEWSRPSHDWKRVAVKKVGRAVLLSRLPGQAQVWLRSEFSMSTALLETMELLEGNATADATTDERIKVAACYTSRKLMQSWLEHCFDSRLQRLDVPGCVTPKIVCPVGQYYNVSGFRCLLCPVGTFCPKGANEPHPCQPGSTTHSEGQKEEEACKCDVGMEVQWARSTEQRSFNCTPCPQGMYKPTVHNGKCTGWCPSNSTSDPGATALSFCKCESGYFLYDIRSWTCLPCPAGARCSGGFRGDVSLYARAPPDELPRLLRPLHQPPEALPGYFGFSLEPPDNPSQTHKPLFSTCPIRGTCLGNNTCKEGTYGKLCRVCRPGYHRVIEDGSCESCSMANSGLRSKLIWRIVELPAYWAIIRLAVIANSDGAVLTPVFAKILLIFLKGFHAIITITRPQRRALLEASPNPFIKAILVDILDGVNLMDGVEKASTGLSDFTVCRALASEDTNGTELDEEAAERNSETVFALFMVESLLVPFTWPAVSVAALLLLTCWCHRSDSGNYMRKMRFLERMNLLAGTDGDEDALHYANVVIQDYMAHLEVTHSIAGIWRPVPIVWRMSVATIKDGDEVVAEVIREPKGKRATVSWFLQSFSWNMVSLFSIFWFFTHTSTIKMCATLMVSCVRTLNVETGEMELRHVSEPTVVCYAGGTVNLIMTGLGTLGLLLYGLGVPALIAFTVFRKMQYHESWSFAWHVNGYSCWGSIFVYWDVVILVWSAMLGVLMSLSKAYTTETQSVLLLVNSTFMLLHSFFEPFDGRRNDILNILESRSLAAVTLAAPLISAAVQFSHWEQHTVSGSCVVVLIVLVVRFLARIVTELIREFRDALMLAKKEVEYAVVEKEKMKMRLETRAKNTQKFMHGMLREHEADEEQNLHRRSSWGSSVDEAAASPTYENMQKKLAGMFTNMKLGNLGNLGNLPNLPGLPKPKRDIGANMMNWVSTFDAEDAPDEDSGSDLSGLSVLAQEQEVPHKRAMAVISKLTDFIRSVDAMTFGCLSSRTWRSIWRLLSRESSRFVNTWQRMEEMQNSYGLILMKEESTFRFVGTDLHLLSRIAAKNIDSNQRREVVDGFHAMFRTLLSQHYVSRLPLAFPEIFLKEAAYLASSDKRSLKWRLLINTARRMVDDLEKRSADDLQVGLANLDGHMCQWLQADKLAGRLVKVNSLQNYVLQAQSARKHFLTRALSKGVEQKTVLRKVERACGQSADPTEVAEADAETEGGTMNFEWSVFGESRSNSSIWEVSEDKYSDMVVYEEVPTSRSPSHLADFFTVASQSSSSRVYHHLKGGCFWASLDGMFVGDSDDDEALEITKTLSARLTTSAPQSELLRRTSEYEPQSLELSAWPLETPKRIAKLVTTNGFLDNRCKYTLLRIQEQWTLELLKHLGTQQDALQLDVPKQQQEGGWFDKVANVASKIERCRVRARSTAQGQALLKVLDSAEAFIGALGLRQGSMLISELADRLGTGEGASHRPTWLGSPAQWLEHAVIARMDMTQVGNHYTPLRVPFWSPEDGQLMYSFHRALRSKRYGHAEKAGHWILYDFQPKLQQVRSWPTWQAFLRRKLSLGAAVSFPEDPAKSAAGLMLEASDWKALRPRLSGKSGKIFGRQLWAVLEEWRQRMLDWTYAECTHHTLQSSYLHFTSHGVPYKYELENYHLGAAQVKKRGYAEAQDLPLDTLRRAFAVKDEAQLPTMVWCRCSGHELVPGRLVGSTTMTCSVCEQVLPEDGYSCCMLCHTYLCERCERLSTLLSSQVDIEDNVLSRYGESHEILEAMEYTEPLRLLDELGNLDGMMNCTVQLDDCHMTCGFVLMWAKQRALSRNSFLSRLLCMAARHVMGRNESMNDNNTCMMCGRRELSRRKSGRCHECKYVFCEACIKLLFFADFLREEIIRFWHTGFIDLHVEEKLLDLVSTSAPEAVEVVSRLRTKREDERDFGLRHKDASHYAESTMDQGLETLMKRELQRGAPVERSVLATSIHTTRNAEVQANLIPISSDVVRIEEPPPALELAIRDRAAHDLAEAQALVAARQRALVECHSV